MRFRIIIDVLAQRDIDDFAAYTSSYDLKFAAVHFSRLDELLSEIAESPFPVVVFCADRRALSG